MHNLFCDFDSLKGFRSLSSRWFYYMLYAAEPHHQSIWLIQLMRLLLEMFAIGWQGETIYRHILCQHARTRTDKCTYCRICSALFGYFCSVLERRLNRRWIAGLLAWRRESRTAWQITDEFIDLESISSRFPLLLLITLFQFTHSDILHLYFRFRFAFKQAWAVSISSIPAPFCLHLQ